MPAPVLTSGVIRLNVGAFTATGNQFFPHAVGLANGHIAVTWNTTNGHELLVTRTDGTEGAVLSSGTVSNGTQGPAGSQADVAQTSDGRIVWAWSSNAVDAAGDIQWRYLDVASDTFSSITTNTFAGANTQVTIAGGSYGRFAMLNVNAGTGDDVQRTAYNVFGQPYYTDGEITAGNAEEGNQTQPNIATLSDGRFIAVYKDSTDGNVKGVILFSDGTRPGGAPLLLGTNGPSLSGIQDDVIGVTATPDGGFAIAWSNPATGEITFRKFDATGTATMAQTAITGLGTLSPSIIALADGRLVVAATTNSLQDIQGQMIRADGSLDGGFFNIANTAEQENQIELAALADGRFAAVYSANGVTGGDLRDIVMKLFDPREAGLVTAASDGDDDWRGTAFADLVFMGKGNDKINAGDGVDFIYGGDGNDLIYGAAGNDTLVGDNGDDGLYGESGEDALLGGLGNDTLSGGDANDFLYGGAGADILNGGSGFDYASYLLATTGVYVDMTTPANNFGESVGDSYTSIEGLIGSTFADTLAGNAADNWIYGDGGDDVLYGMGGNDVLIGGGGNDFFHGGAGADAHYGEAGTDRVYYINALAGVTIDLANIALNTGEAAGDSYSSIEYFIGSTFADTIRGDDSVNTLFGSNGNDTLVGRGGNDIMYGGNDNDVLIGGLGGDALLGEAGFDYASYAEHLGGLTADLQLTANNTGEASGDTYDSIEGLIGTLYNDSLRGDAAGNWIYGGGGNDFIYGRDGNDVLIGEAGSYAQKLVTALVRRRFAVA